MTPTVTNIVVAISTAFVISAASAMTVDWKNQEVDSNFLRQNTEAVKELTSAVKELQINQAIFIERYVTRSELESKLKESK